MATQQVKRVNQQIEQIDRLQGPFTYENLARVFNFAAGQVSSSTEEAAWKGGSAPPG